MVGSARVIQAVVVSPTTSLQVLKRLALSRRYSWETVRIWGCDMRSHVVSEDVEEVD
jgi:hypothetical protein